MKKTLIATAILGILGGTLAFSHNAYGQTVNSPVEDSDRGQSAYYIATEYCKDKGYLAQYSVLGSDLVIFSCGNNPAKTIQIRK